MTVEYLQAAVNRPSCQAPKYGYVTAGTADCWNFKFGS